jgi:ATP-dependent Clp protease ATP-binding subunit ClpB
VEIQLRHVSALLAGRGYRLDFSPEARAYLAEVGYDADYGARPLKRAIQRELQDPLAVKILSGEFREGATIHVERGPEGLAFSGEQASGPAE